MKFSHLFLILFLGLTACNNSSTGEAEATTTANPVDQKKIDANLIAAYAKENGLQGSITPSGIFYSIEKQGEGPSAKDLTTSSPISAHYHGTFLDGRVFDSSVKRGTPFDFKLGEVIPGWQESLKLLNKGGKGIFIIPSHLAYGQRGYPRLIEPNTVLKFEVELLEFSNE